MKLGYIKLNIPYLKDMLNSSEEWLFKAEMFSQCGSYMIP